MRKAAILTLAAAVAIGAAGNASAGILYSTVGSTYTENFNDPTLPATNTPYVLNSTPAPTLIPFNANHVQVKWTTGGANVGYTAFVGGWKDDTAANATNIGVPGWYLYHNYSGYSSDSSGDNGHQRFGYATTLGTDRFNAFSSGTTVPLGAAEKALGVYQSTNLRSDRNYIGLQLINGTTETLHSFTITYDGEQYRDAGNASETSGFDFQYSLTATNGTWNASTGFTGFASFLAPKNGTTSVALDGNAADNRIANITHTFSDIDWAPGAELWIRWRSVTGNNDAIAIDNVRFSASTDIPEPSAMVLLAISAVCCGMRRRK